MKSVIIDGRMPAEMQRRLMLLGYNLLPLPALSTAPEAIGGHPDTLLFRLGDDIVTSCDYSDAAAYIFSDIRELYPDISVHFTSDVIGKRYPSDAVFNALTVGDKMFFRRGSISEKVISLAEKGGLRLIEVRQGYPACSTLVLSESAVVTSDRGLAKSFRAEGLEVILISEGHISLPPYGYGFIGGASALDGDRLFFFGNIDLHPDADVIRNAAERYGITVYSLSDCPLADLGGAVFLE